MAKDVLCFSKSGIDDSIVSRVLTGRSFDSLSILVRSTLAAEAKLVSMDTHFIAISLKNIAFVSVYLSTCYCSEEYKSKLLDILCAVGECIDKHPGFSIFLGGDFNFVFNDSKWSCRTLLEFFEEYTVAPVLMSTNSPTSYSYSHDSLQRYFLIDYFCVSKDLLPLVSSSSTIDVGNNLSDHLPLETCLILNSTSECHNNNNKVSNTAYQLRWDKSYLRLYVFDLCRLCFLFKQSTHIISVRNIFTMCLVLLSLTNYVQFIL